MANATAKVNKAAVPASEWDFTKRSADTLAAPTQFFTRAFIGADANGYLCKGDDSQGWLLAGVVRGREGDPVIGPGTGGDGTLDLDLERPVYIEVAIAGVQVTDVGKTVYALDDQTGTLDCSATTFNNVLGQVEDIVTFNGQQVANLAWVRLAYDGISANHRLATAGRLPPTVNSTLNFSDVGATIFCASTAPITVTLPPIAQVPCGRWIKIVKDHPTDTNVLTIKANAAETIEGANTCTLLNNPFYSVTLQSNGTQWVVGGKRVS